MNHLRLDQTCLHSNTSFTHMRTWRTGSICFNASSHETIPNNKHYFFICPYLLPIWNIPFDFSFSIYQFLKLGHDPLSLRWNLPQLYSLTVSECLGCGVGGWDRVLWDIVHLIERETGIEDRKKEQEKFSKYAKKGKWLKLWHICIRLLSMYILMLHTICNKINAYVTHGPSQPIRDKGINSGTFS